MSFIINDLKPLIQEAIQYGDLSNGDECVANPNDFKAAMFVGFTKGEIYCVVFKKQFEKQIINLFKASLNALKSVRKSYGSDTKAQSQLATLEDKITPLLEMFPVINLGGAGKLLNSNLELPMIYNY